ncbi:MAG: HD domain-containing protein [Xanthomonadales bacterium]|nr:HD domain-containing protein [Xanthomonadales bacterium]
MTNSQLSREATSWTQPWYFDDPTCVHLGRSTVLELQEEGDKTKLILLDWVPDHSLDALSLVPNSLCPVDGIVARTKSLVDSLQVRELHDYVSDVFRLTDVPLLLEMPRIDSRPPRTPRVDWPSTPLEVATAVSQLKSLDRDDLEIATVYALFHDVGKIWSYEKGTLTAEALELGHEYIGLDRMLPSIRRLRGTWPQGGLILQGLFASVWGETTNAGKGDWANCPLTRCTQRGTIHEKEAPMK